MLWKKKIFALQEDLKLYFIYASPIDSPYAKAKNEHILDKMFPTLKCRSPLEIFLLVLVK